MHVCTCMLEGIIPTPRLAFFYCQTLVAQLSMLAFVDSVFRCLTLPSHCFGA